MRDFIKPIPLKRVLVVSAAVGLAASSFAVPETAGNRNAVRAGNLDASWSLNESIRPHAIKAANLTVLNGGRGTSPVSQLQPDVCASG